MNNIIKTILYVISTLAILGITAGSTSIIQVAQQKTRIDYIEKNYDRIIKKLDSIESKISTRCN